MNSLKKLKMDKKKIFNEKEDVKEVRSSLEEKTAKPFLSFAKSKQKVQELAKCKYLD